jgi:quercetin dioxygenase-like cupin family protein
VKAQPEPAEAVSIVELRGVARELLSSVGAAGHLARTLVRERDLRAVLVAIAADGTMAEHHATGTATVQMLFGQVRVRLPDKVVELTDGELIPIAGGVVHEVVAVTDSAFVLTFAYDAS